MRTPATLAGEEVEQAAHGRHHAAPRREDREHLGRGRRPAGQHRHQLAAPQFLAAQVVGQHAHAGALQHRELEREQVVGGVHGAVLQLERRAARPEQVPAGAAVGRRHRHRRQVAQRPPRRPARRSAAATAGWPPARPPVSPRFLTTRLPLSSRLARTRSATSTPSCTRSTTRLVTCMSMRTCGMRGQEARQHRPDGGLRQRHRAGDAHGAARLGLHLRHRLVGGLGLLAHGHAVAVVDLAGLRQRQLARGALQQAHAQPRFQLGDAARQPGLGQAQRPAGGGETAAVHHLGEEEHVVQVLHDRRPWIEQSNLEICRLIKD